MAYPGEHQLRPFNSSRMSSADVTRLGCWLMAMNKKLRHERAGPQTSTGLEKSVTQHRRRLRVETCRPSLYPQRLTAIALNLNLTSTGVVLLASLIRQHILRRISSRRVHDEYNDDSSSLFSHGTGLFAVRSGGRSPVVGASSIGGGVLINISDLKEIQLAADGKSVYKAFEKEGLAVVGGRNTMVGVGGLTLDGGLSFFSPRFGFVCSNIIEYEIVLADGSVGGANNFGIVTRFTARAFPAPLKIWSGFVYLPSSQAPGVLSASHKVVDRVVTNEEAGHTMSTPLDRRRHMTSSGRHLTAAMDELSVLNPPGRRQEFATTTSKNDRGTLEATHEAYRDAIKEIRQHNVQTMSWTLVLQPMLPAWARKGDPNVWGLADCTNEPLVNDDAIVQRITRSVIKQIDAVATYDTDNLEFMREVSKRYDPDGLFQRSCVGGFKLGVDGGR
ncbi:hypothetical protein DE146DRAFT_678272 [Phaeosphaeria sp. MPI-PUGE-AT-0046c]|nr:hypothetical protein DE146DRAFT_678272 [Phaeosphaeria sp. MPI-PUGE-AT-0046c]